MKVDNMDSNVDSDVQVRELLACALLNLDPRIADKRAALHSVLVEVALSRARNPCDLEEVRDEIDRIVNQRAFLCQEDLDRSIRDCLIRGTITESNGKYELGSKRRDALESASRSADEARDRVRSGLIEQIELEIGRPLPSEQASDICRSVERALADKVYKSSLELARQNLSMEEMLVQLDTVEPLEDLDRVLEESVPCDKPLLREQIRGGISKYFMLFPPELNKTLMHIHHTVLVHQILNLDPSFVRLQREWFSRRRLYLDTNAVLAYVCEGQRAHSIVREVMEATKALGIQVLISPVTLEELGRQVDRAKRNYRRFETDALVRQIAMDGDDAILATYAQIRGRQPSLDWGAFIAPFENLEEMLLDYDILVEAGGFDQAQDSDQLDHIRNAIRDVKDSTTSVNVIEHDTLNCALICHLRELYEPDERGHVVWLLSIDRSLRRAQRILLGADVISGPYCMQAEEWGEMVLPAQNLLGFVFNDFIAYLARARLGAVIQQEVVQLDFIETVRDAEIDVDRLLGFHPDQVRIVLVRLQTDREARSLAIRAAETQDPAQKQACQHELQLRMDEAIQQIESAKLVEEKYSRKTKLLEQHLQQRDRQITELSERLASIESTFTFRILSWIRRILQRD